MRETFRTLGLAHLLALSGFHVALFAGLASLLLYPLRLWRRYARWRHVAMMAAVWFYVLVSGMPASAVRAALMLSIVLGGKMMQRQGVGFNTLAAARVGDACMESGAAVFAGIPAFVHCCSRTDGIRRAA